MSPWEQIVRKHCALHPRFFVVLVCGGRDYSNSRLFDAIMDVVHKDVRELHDAELVIVHGAARGADSLADEWADSRGVPALACPANWDKHGKSAGHIRNAEMLKRWKPTLVVAFPGGRGTAHMVSISIKAGVTVHEVKP